jgi:hypothetical protein
MWVSCILMNVLLLLLLGQLLVMRLLLLQDPVIKASTLSIAIWQCSCL